jgi:hypothetical protein
VTKTKKHDDPHECKKEDIETADMIKADCKACPNCGEFIQKSSGCDQMWCISCQTPFSWTTGKVVTGGIIHNPHYYEWMQRNGGAAPRNPADVPCGGYPNAWELRRMPKGISNSISNIFFEFHRICQELQDISERSYRTHLDQDSTTKVNIKFLLGDFDEKHWGQLLGKNERTRKRDREVQEIFAAFRMVAVELINRVQNYRSDDGKIRTFTDLPVKEAETFIQNLSIEIKALITMINDALRNASISYSYSVPYIHLDGNYYSIKTKNFSDEVKKKRVKKDDDTASTTTEALKENQVIDPSSKLNTLKAIDQAINTLEKVINATESSKMGMDEATKKTTEAFNNVAEAIKIKRKKPVVAPTETVVVPPEEYPDTDDELNSITEYDTILNEDTNLQAAIAASLGR